MSNKQTETSTSSKGEHFEKRTEKEQQYSTHHTKGDRDKAGVVEDDRERDREREREKEKEREREREKDRDRSSGSPVASSKQQQQHGTSATTDYGDNKAKITEAISKNIPAEMQNAEIMKKLEEMEKRLITWEEKLMQKKREFVEEAKEKVGEGKEKVKESIQYIESSTQAKALLISALLLLVAGVLFYFVSGTHHHSYFDPTMGSIRKMQDDILKIKEKTDYLALVLPKEFLHNWDSLLQKYFGHAIHARPGTIWDNVRDTVKDTTQDAYHKTREFAEKVKEASGNILGVERTPEPSWWDSAWKEMKDASVKAFHRMEGELPERRHHP